MSYWFQNNYVFCYNFSHFLLGQTWLEAENLGKSIHLWFCFHLRMTFLNVILNLVLWFFFTLKNFFLEIKSRKLKINMSLNMKLKLHKDLDSLPAVVFLDVSRRSIRWEKFILFSMYWCIVSTLEIGMCHAINHNVQLNNIVILV